MKIRTLYLLLLTPLTGCSNSDIDTIKGGRLDIQPQYTVGEAFDNRKVCKETSWEAFEDNRQRSIVEYRCYLNGYDAVYKDKAQAISRGLEKLEAKLTSKRTHLTEAITEAEAKLPEARQALADFDPQEAAKQFDEKIAYYKDFLSGFGSHDVDYYIDNGVDIPKELPGLTVDQKLASAKQYKAQGNDYMVQELKRQISSDLSSIWNATTGLINRMEAGKETTIRSHQNSLLDDVHTLEQRIEDSKSKLVELDGEYADFEELRAQKQAEEKSLLATASDAQAYEYYQWTVLDDESFMIVAGGIMEKEPGQEEFSDKPYSRPADTVALAYQDDASDFTQYKQAIGAKAWLRFLGY